MKWQQGLAVITRAEHWDLASKHLWGLSGSDIAAFLHSPSPTPPLFPQNPLELNRAQISQARQPGMKAIEQSHQGRKIEPSTATQEV